MQTELKTLLPRRDKVGYIAARNFRIIREALTEYNDFKNELIGKYGENGAIAFDSPNFPQFKAEFEPISEVEQEIAVMKLDYEEVIGLLNGEEILKFEWFLKEAEG
jgi:hypothetical protein